MDRIKDVLGKLIVICLGTLSGMFVGSFIIYFLVAFIYIGIFGSGPVTNSDECARGMAIGWLSIIGGALLGAALGCCGCVKYVKSFDVKSEAPSM